MTCQNCGADIPDGQTTCPTCQAAIVPPPPAQGPAAPPPDAQQPAAPADVAGQPPAPAQPQAPPRGPIVATPHAQQPVQPPVVPGAVPPPPGQAPPVQAPYPYADPRYAWPPPPPKRQGKPVVLIIIIVLTFLGAFGSLFGVVSGQADFILGMQITGGAARVVSLLLVLVQVAVGVGLILMTRWGWWLAIIESLFGAFSTLLAIPHAEIILDIAMQDTPYPPPPEMMPIMSVMIAGGMVFGALVQVAIIAYLVWKRELFGIDVESPSEADQADGPSAGPPEPPAPTGPDPQQQ